MFEERPKEGEPPTIKLSDFGGSATYEPLRGKKRTKNKQYMRDVVGSLYTTAPEVFEREYDEKVDVWSVGVIMYMLLTGEPPFSGATEPEIIKNIRTGICDLEHPLLLECTPEARELLGRLLEFSPSKRISADGALRHAWSKLFDDH